MYVEECSDELWVGVKCQSNTEIAGSPRNAFRCSVICLPSEVELTESARGLTGLLNRIKLRMPTVQRWQ